MLLKKLMLDSLESPAFAPHPKRSVRRLPILQLQNETQPRLP